jgi:hypothetical protein
MGVLKLPAPLRRLAIFLNETFGGLTPRLWWNAAHTDLLANPEPANPESRQKAT